jgi:hypothetical protein
MYTIIATVYYLNLTTNLDTEVDLYFEHSIGNVIVWKREWVVTSKRFNNNNNGIRFPVSNRQSPAHAHRSNLPAIQRQAINDPKQYQSW